LKAIWWSPEYDPEADGSKENYAFPTEEVGARDTAIRRIFSFGIIYF
jgi:hypothetical protein